MYVWCLGFFFACRVLRVFFFSFFFSLHISIYCILCTILCAVQSRYVRFYLLTCQLFLSVTVWIVYNVDLLAT